MVFDRINGMALSQKLAELAMVKVDGNTIDYFFSLKDLVWTEFFKILSSIGVDAQEYSTLASAFKEHEELLPEPFRKNMGPLVRILFAFEKFQLVNELDGRPVGSTELASQMISDFLDENESGVWLLIELLRGVAAKKAPSADGGSDG
jgi:hypothetical protein